MLVKKNKIKLSHNMIVKQSYWLSIVQHFREMFSILLFINFVLCEADWVKISQIPTSEFQKYSTESTVDIAKIDKEDAPIRYEDLEHIIGPGFEDELEKFYQRHKEEMDRKVNEERPQTTISGTSQTYKDPWSVYDNPLHIGALKEPISVTDISDSELDESTMLNDKNRYEEYDEADHLNGSSNENYENVTMPTVPVIPKVVQFKFVKVKPKEAEPFSFSGFMKFLRDIQSSFVTKTARSIKDKIQTLEQFRDDILINIEERIRSLWPSTPVVRSKRGLMDGHHGGGGMEFPSSEGALMTISFLTFAVFLIKLVLQVINTIKSKHYSYNGFDKLNGGGVAAVNIVKQNRNARSLSMTPDDLNGMQRILGAIDSVGKM